MKEEQINKQKFILKFFPEIMIKGPKAKREMTGQLYNNLQKILFRISDDIYIKKHFDKIEIYTPKQFLNNVRAQLLCTPGIELILEVLQFDKITTIDQIKEILHKNTLDKIKDKTFVLRAKRSGTHDFKSTDIEQQVGGYLLAKGDSKGVDLRTPQITLNIELINNQLNIVNEKYKGLSGFPIGTQGSILSLMSGGFDSTVASYLTMKRGIKTHFIFFNLGGTAHEIGVKQVAYYLWDKFGSSHKVSFISINFDDVVSEIFNSIHESYMGVMLKRLMLQASQKIADDLGIDALLTGESVAQVSSQTLRNLALIDKATNKLILRPLSTMNKPEIIEIANKIGTKEFAQAMPEYCGVISKNPVTHGSYDRVEKEVAKFNYDILDKSVINAKSININEIINDISNNISKIPIISDISSGDYVVIDIRQGEQCISTSCETLKIPFHKLKNEFKKLPKNKKYLFYCDKGILSQLHAQYLIDEQSYTNIKIYRPI